MIGSTAIVHNWRGDQGQVVWKDEFWQAHTRVGRSLMAGDKVVIESISGLTLIVVPFESELNAQPGR